MKKLTKREKEILFLLVEDALDTINFTGSKDLINKDYKKLEEADKKVIEALFDKLK